jgi:hypothetical protein
MDSTVRHLLVALSLCLCSVAFAQETAKSAVSRVEIESSWAGLNPRSPLQDHIVIERQGDTYRLSGSHRERHWADHQPEEQALASEVIAPALIAQLRDALSEPSQPMVDLHDLAPASTGIQSKIDQDLKEAGLNRAAPPLSRRIAQWRQDLRKPEALNKVLTRGFAGSHTDDYPSVRVTLTLADGSTLTASSGSQHHLLLPWKDRGGNPTYAPAIARAVHALLPDQAVNRARLEGDASDDELDEVLSYGLEDSISRFQVEKEAPDALHMLEARFVIERISLNHWNGSHVDAGLRLFDSPANLTIGARMALAGTRLKNVGDAERARQLLQLAQSSPTLLARMRSGDHADFSIRYGYPMAWPQRRVVTQFVEQMHEMKALADLNATSSLVSDAVLVEEGMGPLYWVVLPDGRTILWKKFASTSNGPNTRPCAGISWYDEETDNLSDDDQCMGKVYDARGNEL